MAGFINLSDVVNEVCKTEKNPISNMDKVRSKYLEIFEMLNIDRESLKKGNDYCLPEASMDFLVSLYRFYSDSEVKKMRKGMFEAASIKAVEKLLIGFTELINGLEISAIQKENMISKMYLRTKYPYLLKRDAILKELREMELDFVPDYKNDYKVEDMLKQQIQEDGRPNFEKQLEIHSKRRFRYFDFCDLMDVNDEVVFATYVLNDFRAMLNKHREIYNQFTVIRQCEIDRAIDEKVSKMTKEEDLEAIDDFNYSVALQEELDKNEEYNALIEERSEILRSESFVKKVQPRFSAIIERINEIDRETQIALWGEVVVHDPDYVNKEIDFRKPSMDVLMQALVEFQDDNRYSREYRKQRDAISEEEMERTREWIEKMCEERRQKKE